MAAKKISSQLDPVLRFVSKASLGLWLCTDGRCNYNVSVLNLSGPCRDFRVTPTSRQATISAAIFAKLLFDV